MNDSVVVLEKNPEVPQSLAGRLRPHFTAVLGTVSRDEMRARVADTHPEAVVVDIEYSRLAEVESLHRDFPELPIVCTHRVPDEAMWMAALDAGASDICATDEVTTVLTSVLRSVSVTRGAGA
jgi:DNA-binding NarL/FixJ family response regulator